MSRWRVLITRRESEKREKTDIAFGKLIRSFPLETEDPNESVSRGQTDRQFTLEGFIAVSFRHVHTCVESRGLFVVHSDVKSWGKSLLCTDRAFFHLYTLGEVASWHSRQWRGREPFMNRATVRSQCLFITPKDCPPSRDPLFCVWFCDPDSVVKLAEPRNVCKCNANASLQNQMKRASEFQKYIYSHNLDQKTRTGIVGIVALHTKINLYCILKSIYSRARDVNIAGKNVGNLPMYRSIWHEYLF